MIKLPLLTTLLIAAITISYSQTPALTESLLPIPQQSRFTGKKLNLDKSWVININSESKDSPAFLSLLDELQSRYKIKLPLRSDKPTNSISLIINDGAVEIGNTTDTNRTALKRQAYRLKM